MSIEQIAENIRTQDNRCTDQPLFAVQEKERIFGLDSDYSSDYVWYNHAHCDVEEDEDEIKQLEKLDNSGELPDHITKAYYVDKWEFVTACFTEQGCKDYITANRHNHGKTRIYAYGSYRNAEFQAVRKYLMEDGSVAQSENTQLLERVANLEQELSAARHEIGNLTMIVNSQGGEE